MAAVTGIRSLHQAVASAVVDAVVAVAAVLAVAVVAVAAATPAIAVVETPVEATVALRKMSAATEVRKGTEPMNARRRSATRRVTPQKPRKKRSPRCSWQARL
jgi:hypothetical protein